MRPAVTTITLFVLLGLVMPGVAVAQTAKHYDPYYLPAARLDYAATIGLPPQPGTLAAQRDLEAVRQAEKTRTPAEVKQAQIDDVQEDIFLYKKVLGPDFNASTLPVLAAISAHLRNDVGVISPPLKARYNRSRPFLVDRSLHPVCEQKTEGSFPSGHSVVGYITGLVLAQMLPERAPAILARAGEYAQNRVVCGVHYPADTDASRTLALAMLGELSASAHFQEDLRAAKDELRQHHFLP